MLRLVQFTGAFIVGCLVLSAAIGTSKQAVDGMFTLYFLILLGWGACLVLAAIGRGTAAATKATTRAAVAGTQYVAAAIQEHDTRPSPPPPPPTREELFAQYEREYQESLALIRRLNLPPDEADEVALQARNRFEEKVSGLL